MGLSSHPHRFFLCLFQISPSDFWCVQSIFCGMFCGMMLIGHDTSLNCQWLIDGYTMISSLFLKPWMHAMHCDKSPFVWRPFGKVGFMMHMRWYAVFLFYDIPHWNTHNVGTRVFMHFLCRCYNVEITYNTIVHVAHHCLHNGPFVSPYTLCACVCGDA